MHVLAGSPSRHDKEWVNHRNSVAFSPVKRSLFQGRKATNQSRPLFTDRSNQQELMQRQSLCDEDLSKRSCDSLPFQNYIGRRDSGCLDQDESASCALRAANSSFSSGEENISDFCFSSPVKSVVHHQYAAASRHKLTFSPSSSSGVSCTSPARTPPETPPHTRKLRALTLFDTPRTPKTLMRKLKPHLLSGDHSKPTQHSPETPASYKKRAQIEPLQQQPPTPTSQLLSDCTSRMDGSDEEDMETYSLKPPSFRPTPHSSRLVNVNPFTPDNRSSAFKRSRPSK